jgi:hypothetical protein
MVIALNLKHTVDCSWREGNLAICFLIEESWCACLLKKGSMLFNKNLVDLNRDNQCL